MNIHSCSYYCHIPACIKAQRDDLRDKLAQRTEPASEDSSVAQQRTWVGLTKQQRNNIEDICEMIIGEPAFDAIEAQLKENNAYRENE
jgi:hypothetical protein